MKFFVCLVLRNLHFMKTRKTSFSVTNYDKYLPVVILKIIYIFENESLYLCHSVRPLSYYKVIMSWILFVEVEEERPQKKPRVFRDRLNPLENLSNEEYVQLCKHMRELKSQTF